MKHEKNRMLEVTITRFSKKGNGIGQSTDEPSKVVEVPFAIPGDTVAVTTLGKQKGIYASRLEEVVNPSLKRIKPRCIHFGSCGGCRWQQMTYEEQLKIKQEQVETLFNPLMNDDTVFNPIAPCDPSWQYRNKMEFSFSSDAAANKYLGLIISGSRGKVLNLTECHLVNPWFIECLEAVREWWKESTLKAYHPNSNTGSLRTLIVREGMKTGDRLVMITVSGNPDYALKQHDLDQFVAAVRIAVEPYNTTSKLSIFLRIQQASKGVETTFYEMVLHGPDHIREILEVQAISGHEPQQLDYIVSPSAFFQPNTRQAERLYSLALQLLDVSKDTVVYDLYCGTGSIGISLAKYVKLVVGIEISEESSLDGRTNVIKNHLENVHILTGSVRDVLQQIRTANTYPMPEVVILDPPRVGLDPETIQHLNELRPEKIIYISCNPVTQADNIKELKQMGYELTAIQPVDQFPHTVHIENIAILKLRRT